MMDSLGKQLMNFIDERAFFNDQDNWNDLAEDWLNEWLEAHFDEKQYELTFHACNRCGIVDLSVCERINGRWLCWMCDAYEEGRTVGVTKA